MLAAAAQLLLLMTMLATSRVDKDESERGEISEKAVLLAIFVPLGLAIGAFVTVWAWSKINAALQ